MLLRELLPAPAYPGTHHHPRRRGERGGFLLLASCALQSSQLIPRKRTRRCPHASNERTRDGRYGILPRCARSRPCGERWALSKAANVSACSRGSVGRKAARRCSRPPGIGPYAVWAKLRKPWKIEEHLSTPTNPRCGEPAHHLTLTRHHPGGSATNSLASGCTRVSRRAERYCTSATRSPSA
jgi:hypothetical protein